MQALIQACLCLPAYAVLVSTYAARDQSSPCGFSTIDRQALCSVAGRIQGKVRMTFLALVLLACAKTNSGATTVLVDELDASRFRMRAE